MDEKNIWLHERKNEKYDRRNLKGGNNG